MTKSLFKKKGQSLIDRLSEKFIHAVLGISLSLADPPATGLHVVLLSPVPTGNIVCLSLSEALFPIIIIARNECRRFYTRELGTGRNFYNFHYTVHTKLIPYESSVSAVSWGSVFRTPAKKKNSALWAFEKGPYYNYQFL